MTTMLPSFKTAGRALLVATVLGAGGIAAAPAMAQSEPSFNFNLAIGQNGQPSFGFAVQDGNSYGGGHHGRNGGGGFNGCMSDDQVVRSLRDQGYSRIGINDSSRRQAEVDARYGRFVYVLDVNKCSGSVDIVDRHRIGGGGYNEAGSEQGGYHRRGGFNH